MVPAIAVRSVRAETVTCPRAIRRRSASRTSGSHRASSLGSLMLGEKNRWLTVRSSTLTRDPPTAPSAAPNPVMLRIMNSRASYELTTTLSIEEVPAHAVVVGQPRHLKAGNHRVDLARHIAVLPRNRSIVEPQLEQRGDDLILRGKIGGRGSLPGKQHRRAILVRHRGKDVEVPLGKSSEPARVDIE